MVSASPVSRLKKGAHQPTISLFSKLGWPVATSVQEKVDTLHVFWPVGWQCRPKWLMILVESDSLWGISCWNTLPPGRLACKHDVDVKSLDDGSCMFRMTYSRSFASPRMTVGSWRKAFATSSLAPGTPALQPSKRSRYFANSSGRLSGSITAYPSAEIRNWKSLSASMFIALKPRDKAVPAASKTPPTGFVSMTSPDFNDTLVHPS